jgi:hypothetical protein
MRPLSLVTAVMTITFLPFTLLCLAQAPDKTITYDVAILADGKQIDPVRGIQDTTKELSFTGQLTKESRISYPQLKPDVTIGKATINLVRDTQRVGFINWPGTESLSSLFKQAKAGDRCLIQFDEVSVRSNQGVAQKVKGFKLIQITIR